MLPKQKSMVRKIQLLPVFDSPSIILRPGPSFIVEGDFPSPSAVILVIFMVTPPCAVRTLDYKYLKALYLIYFQTAALYFLISINTEFYK